MPAFILRKADFCFLVLYPLSDIYFHWAHKKIFLSLALYPFVQMIIFTGRGAVGSADIQFAKGIFCVDVLILCLMFIFTGRGARM